MGRNSRKVRTALSHFPLKPYEQTTPNPPKTGHSSAGVVGTIHQSKGQDLLSELSIASRPRARRRGFVASEHSFGALSARRDVSMARVLRRVGILLVALASLSIGMAIMRPDVAPTLSTSALLGILGLAVLPLAALAMLVIERSSAGH